MREIEYRAKSDLSKEEMEVLGIPNKNGWVYGYLVDGWVLGEIYEGGEEYIQPSWWVSIQEGTVEQYTGIKDIHGVKIYEGNIVRHEGNMVGKVYYDEAETSYILEPMNKKSSYEVLGLSCGLEIIGDIHENPELEEY